MRTLTPVLTLFACLLLGPLSSQATPIKVDLNRLLDQAEKSTPYQYVPARAGWNGPEKPVVVSTAVVPAQDMEVRRWLWRLAIPDPRMLTAFAAAIFGLRLFRRVRETRLGIATA